MMLIEEGFGLFPPFFFRAKKTEISHVNKISGLIFDFTGNPMLYTNMSGAEELRNRCRVFKYRKTIFSREA